MNEARRLTALALLVALWTQAVRADSRSDAATLRARWLLANRASIARLHPAGERASARKEFEATLARTNGAVPPALRPNDLRAAAGAELARPGRYQLADQIVQPREKTLWERFWEWIGTGFDRIWKALFGRAHLGRNGAMAIGDILIALVGVALIAVMFRLLVNLQIERDVRRTSYELLDSRQSAHILYLRACGLAASGAFAEAVRTLFIAAVVALDLRGILRDEVSATVGEMRRELRSRDVGLSTSFDRVASAFVAAAYAEVPIAAGDWERAREGYAELTRRNATA